MIREDVRNIAIIAHVDHGKTTLVDELLKQSGVFRENQEVAERVMDSNDIERERGITILSKNTAVTYKNTKINIIDTPGHADFGGEVERVLKMVNGVVLVVDAFEGAMPQTRFVLKKALELNLPVIVCINKIDRPEARPEEVIDEVLELFIELDANEEQLDCPFVFASAKQGFAKLNMDDESDSMQPLFETIIDYIPAPEGDENADTQVLISTIDYNEYVGRIGVGKIDNGKLKVNQDVVLVNHHEPDKQKRVKISKLYEFDGLNKVEVQEATVGAIVAISGITGFAVLVAKFTPLSASDFSFVANILLLVVGWIILGKSFAAKTAYSTILLSVTLSLFERVYPMSHPLTNEPLLELIFAILLPALGSAILFNIGASSGGTDVIAMVLKKYTSVDIGRGLMISDVLFTLCAFFVFDVKTGLYSLLGLIMRSALIDNFIESLNRSKYFHVVCSDPKPICNFIEKDLVRGATIVNAKGSFTGDNKYIILTVLSPSQAVKLRNFIKENSPGAFLLISNTSEIIGKGFHSV